MTALVRTHESKAPENAEVVVINDRYRALCWLEDAYSMAAVVVGVSGQDFDQIDDRGCTGYVSNIREATVIAHGQWKWDGCANIMFDDCARNCMLHFCGADDFSKFAEIGTKLYAHARTLQLLLREQALTLPEVNPGHSTN
jgi:hypothetical protein